jgi:hypothetical protein
MYGDRENEAHAKERVFVRAVSPKAVLCPFAGDVCPTLTQRNVNTPAVGDTSVSRLRRFFCQFFTRIEAAG